MLHHIHQFASGGCAPYGDILEMIKAGHFDDLKNTLYNDYCDILKVLRVSEAAEAKLLANVLATLIRMWWKDPLESRVDNYQEWEHTGALFHLRKELRGSTSITATLTAITTSVIAGIEEKEEIAARKSVFEDELENELERAVEQRLNWDVLEGMGLGVRHLPFIDLLK
jgi:hypothetical protein